MSPAGRKPWFKRTNSPIPSCVSLARETRMTKWIETLSQFGRPRLSNDFSNGPAAVAWTCSLARSYKQTNAQLVGRRWERVSFCAASLVIKEWLIAKNVVRSVSIKAKVSSLALSKRERVLGTQLGRWLPRGGKFKWREGDDARARAPGAFAYKVLLIHVLGRKELTQYDSVDGFLWISPKAPLPVVPGREMIY